MDRGHRGLKTRKPDGPPSYPHWPAFDGQQVVGFEGKIVTDPSKRDGTPRKLLSSERMRNMGWQPRIGLMEGIAETYRWYVEAARSHRGLRAGPE